MAAPREGNISSNRRISGRRSNPAAHSTVAHKINNANHWCMSQNIARYRILESMKTNKCSRNRMIIVNAWISEQLFLQFYYLDDKKWRQVSHSMTISCFFSNCWLIWAEIKIQRVLIAANAKKIRAGTTSMWGKTIIFFAASNSCY